MAKYTENKNALFINPYSFVSISNKKVVRGQNAEEKTEDKLYTGFFDCVLENKTPLAIPNVIDAVKDAEVDEHLVYPVFRIGDDITIPGSSLRGPIRAMYETLTNSCMSTMKLASHITRRSDLGSFSPCVLKKQGEEWRLFKAKRIALVGREDSGYKHIDGSYEKFKIIKIGEKENQTKYLLTEDNEKIGFGEEVSVEEGGPGHIKFNRKKNTQIEVWKGGSIRSIHRAKGTDCFLFLGEMIDNKHAESVFKIQDSSPEQVSSEKIKKALEALEDTLDIYRSTANKNLGQTHFGYRGYENARSSGKIPLWYKYENGKLYLSLAAIGRITYQNDMSAISNAHSPCVDRKSLCPACAVFGMVGGKDESDNEKGKGLGSHVRITDAVLISGEVKEEKVTLKELGAPNPSYLPFYSDGNKEYDSEGAVIRGRKFYWHNAIASRDDSVYKTSEKTKRNATMELVDNGAIFSFRIYYDNLSRIQIDNLIWTLTLGGNNTSYMYKMGHGKSLGLGSCKIKIKGMSQRFFDPLKAEYSIKSESDELGFDALDEKNVDLDKDAWEQVKVISEYKETEVEIRYPFVKADEDAKEMIKERIEKGIILKENVLASHRWFSDFRTKGQTLPDLIRDNDMTMCSLKAIDIGEKDFEIPKPKLNKEYKGRVTGYNPKGTFALVRLDNGMNASFFDKQHKYEGCEVTVVYKGKKTGKNGKTFDDWELVDKHG